MNKLLSPVKKSGLAVILLLVAVFIGGAGEVRADGAWLVFINCSPGSCPRATGISISGTLDRTSYTPGQAVYLNVNAASDDYPQYPSGVSPVAFGNINGGANSTDAFPSTYTQQQLRTGISGSVYLGIAPSVSGTVYTTYSSAGYNVYSGSIPLTVATPAPTVSSSFSPSTIYAGQTSNYSWSSTNAIACDITHSNGVGGWPGAPTSYSTGYLNWDAYAPSLPTDVDCYNSVGQHAYSSVTLTINPPRSCSMDQRLSDERPVWRELPSLMGAERKRSDIVLVVRQLG